MGVQDLPSRIYQHGIAPIRCYHPSGTHARRSFRMRSASLQIAFGNTVLSRNPVIAIVGAGNWVSSFSLRK